jgi:hypothetical protein
MAGRTLRINLTKLRGKFVFLSTMILILVIRVTDTHAEIVKGSVSSVRGNVIELNIGAEKGIRVGDSGRVYYQVKVDGKDQAIYIARVKVIHLSEKSSSAQIEEKTADLRKGLLVEIRITLGELELKSEPSGATVSMNGKEMGQTPLVLSGIRLGQHLIRFAKEEHHPYEEQIDLTGPERKKVVVSLQRIVGGLSISTEPSGASVVVNGRSVGTSPYEDKDLPPGLYKVRIEKEGYTPWEGSLTVIAGRKIEVPIELKPRVGDLEILSDPSGAKVYVDGKEMGQTPLSLPGLRVGQRRIRVVGEGREPYEEEAWVREGKNRIFASLKRLSGDLSISTDPPLSNLYINEKSVGTSPYEGMDLLPGNYKVKVSKAGYETREMDVVVRAGERTIWDIKLNEIKKEALMPPPAKPEAKITEAPKGRREVDWAKISCEAPIWNVGNKWRYRGPDGKIWTNEVVEIKEDLYILKTEEDEDLRGYDQKTMNLDYWIDKSGRRTKNTLTSRKLFDFPILVGKKWSSSTTAIPTGGRIEANYVNDFKIEKVEEITTPAGKFKAYVLHYRQTNLQSHRSGWVRYWYSPEARNWVKREYEKTSYWRKPSDGELLSYELPR